MSEQITTEGERTDARWAGESAEALGDLEVPEGEAENVQGGAQPCCEDETR